MDPVTIVTIAAIGLVLAPKVLPFVGYGIIELSTRAYNSLKQFRRERKKRSKKEKAKRKRQEAVYKSLIKDYNMEFANVKNSAKRKFNVTEVYNFDQEKDKIFRGKLRVKRKNGVIVEDDIYLFQPRVYANKVLLGPHYTKNGNLSDKYGYTAKIPGSNEYYVGYTPKREIITCRQYDYVSSSLNTDMNTYREFIDIEIPQDKDGNYIPVDLTDKQELENLRRYIELRTEGNQIDPDDFLDSRLLMAEESYKEWQLQNRPRYAKPIVEVSAEEVMRVEKARQDREQRNRYLNMYYGNLINQPPGGMGPMHPGVPMRPMHPGPHMGPMPGGNIPLGGSTINTEGRRGKTR